MPHALDPARSTPSLDERLRYAQELARSSLIPRDYRNHPANVLVALDTGDTLGIAGMAALHNIHIIDGTPALSAALLVALVRRAGHHVRVWGTNQRAVAELVRSDDPDFTYRVEWTPHDAATAGLCHLRDGTPYARDRNGKPLPWEKYPASLLKARAASQACRDGAQDVFLGPIYVPEELGAHVDTDGTPLAEQSPAVLDWDTELQRRAGDYTGLRDLWRHAKRHHQPHDFLDRIRALGEAAALPQSHPVVDADVITDDVADPATDAVLCAGSRQRADADMTLQHDGGRPHGLCPVCGRWRPVTDHTRITDHPQADTASDVA